MVPLALPDDAYIVLFSANRITDNPWKDWLTIKEATAIASERLPARRLILLGLGELRKFDLTVAADAFSPDEVGLPLTAFAVDSYDRTVLGTNPILLPSPPSGPLN